MIRVGFNAYLLSSSSIRGWPRYTTNLLAALPAHGVRPILYSIYPIHPVHLKALPPECYELVHSGPMKYLLWEQWWLPRQCLRDNIQILHSPINYGLPWSSPCPRVLTLHDAIDQVYYAQRGRWPSRLRLSSLRTHLAHWSSRQRAHRVITVSQHAKTDLVNFLGVPESRIHVIPEAADPVFCQPVPIQAVDAVREKWKLTRSYLFYVGGWEERKNVPFLLRAFADADLESVDLVLAGGRPEQQAQLTLLSQQLGIADRVRLLGFIPDEDLSALYKGALAFVYPSEYEGFGLQLVEAMTIGCPVLAADATALPEVLGNGGETFPLDSTKPLAALLRRLVVDEAFRQDLVDRGNRRARDFSWDRTAAMTTAVYRELLSAQQNA